MLLGHSHSTFREPPPQTFGISNKFAVFSQKNMVKYYGFLKYAMSVLFAYIIFFSVLMWKERYITWEYRWVNNYTVCCRPHIFQKWNCYGFTDLQLWLYGQNKSNEIRYRSHSSRLSNFTVTAVWNIKPKWQLKARNYRICTWMKTCNVKIFKYSSFQLNHW